MVRDAPRKRGTYRREEWIAHGVDAEEIHGWLRGTPGASSASARSAPRGNPTPGCGRISKPSNYRPEFNRTGYGASTEAHSSRGGPTAHRACSHRRTGGQIEPDDADQTDSAGTPFPGRSAQAIRRAGRRAAVGWVQSIVVDSATWCSNMHVAPAARRRGIGRALMCRMLRDDRLNGSELAVLTATHTGALLYASIGYVADRHPAVLHAEENGNSQSSERKAVHVRETENRAFAGRGVEGPGGRADYERAGGSWPKPRDSAGRTTTNPWAGWRTYTGSSRETRATVSRPSTFTWKDINHYAAGNHAEKMAHALRHVADVRRDLGDAAAAERDFRLAIQMYRDLDPTPAHPLVNALRGFAMLL